MCDIVLSESGIVIVIPNSFSINKNLIDSSCRTYKRASFTVLRLVLNSVLNIGAEFLPGSATAKTPLLPPSTAYFPPAIFNPEAGSVLYF